MPGTGTHIFKGSFSLTTKLFWGFICFGITGGNVTRAAGLSGTAQVFRWRFKCFHYYQHAVAFASAQVDGVPTGLVAQVPQGI